MENPRAFISHSGQDNERFVIDFARRLRAKGIEAWLDCWELLPGDSLVDKIWNEGLKDCKAFIVVLSKHSVESKWVREELNTGIIKKIEDNTRFIPIRLDGCPVPEALRSTVWVEVEDVSQYELQFERIVNAIYGLYDRPAVGEPPGYVRTDEQAFEGLAAIDSKVLASACRLAIEQGHPDCINGEQIVEQLSKTGVSEPQIMESQEVLDSRGYIRLQRTMGPPQAYSFAITPFGFDVFAQVGIPNYSGLCADVVRYILSRDMATNRGAAQELNLPIRVVEHIFESLEINGLIRFQTQKGGGLHMHVFWVSPELRRKFEGNEVGV